MRIRFAVIVFLLVTPAGGFAEDWAEALFDHTTHDFGVVARGQKVEHAFGLENIYLEDVRIREVRSTCTCTTPRVSKRLLKTYETGEIVAVVDTRQFLGQKDATLTVVFDEPFRAEVQLHCYCYIRSDVVLEPGSIQFGSVPHGTSKSTKVAVSYAGRDDWQILGVQRASEHLDVKVVQTGRGNGLVAYDLLVDLKPTAPVGYLRDHVVLATNDHNPNATRVIIAVEGMVVPGVFAKPSPLELGVLRPGQTVTRHLVVKGQAPFRIVKASGTNDRLKLNVSSSAKDVHVIPVTFLAGHAPGRIAETISVETDIADHETLEVKVTGQIVPVAPETGWENSLQGGTSGVSDSQ